MLHVACLTCNPLRPALDEHRVLRVAETLPDHDRARWLTRGIAAEIPFETSGSANIAALLAAVREALDGVPVDVNILPAEGRRKKLLIADMDSTMIEQECVDELAVYAGVYRHIAGITERAMRGEIVFEAALRERVALLKGLPETVVQRVLKERICVTPGARVLVRTMRGHGAYTALVSSGFVQFTRVVAREIGFDEDRANRLDMAEEKLAGTVAEPVLGREAKREALLELCARLGISPAEALAVGDGANDLAMIGEAGLGVAFRAKPAVAEAAQASIVHGDLTALLYLQGYAENDFVT